MTLTQQQEFDALVEHAKLAGQARDWQGARQYWAKALELVPPDSKEYRLTKARIDNIDLQLSTKNVWAKRFGKLGFKIETATTELQRSGRFAHEAPHFVSGPHP